MKKYRKYHRDVKICKENHPQVNCIFITNVLLKMQLICFKIVKLIFKNKQGKKILKNSHFLCIQKNLAILVALLKNEYLAALVFPLGKNAQLFFLSRN